MSAVDGQLRNLLLFRSGSRPQFGHAEQRARVADPVDTALENKIVAGVFSQPVDPATQPPRNRMIEQDRFQTALNKNREMIPSPQMRQFVCKNCLDVFWRKA